VLSPKTINFVDEILSYIKFPFDRYDIKMEIEGHILDKIDYYLKQGYDKKNAEQISINDMGDAKEIGIALNKQHNPVYGWLWKVTNLIVCLLAVWSIYITVVPTIITLFESNPIKEIPEDNIVYKIDVNEKVKLDDTIINFTEIIYENNEDMNIFYKYYDTRLWGTGWTLGTIGDITDNLGNTYFTGSSAGSAGINSKCIRIVENFSREADTLIICYDMYNRKYRVEIPLKAGEDNE
jgi:hypothetical protein